MLLAFDADLGKLDVYANGDELANIMGRDRDADGRRVTTYPSCATERVVSLPSPVLVTDSFRIAELAPTLRDTVFALCGSAVRITRYDGIELPFDQGRFPGVWGPSIDTLLFCRALRALDLSSVRTAIEIGAGSGFLSKYLLARAHAIERLTICDRSSMAIACAREHVADLRAELVVGDGVEVLARGAWVSPAEQTRANLVKAA